jgi:hypothetical protein
MSVETPASNVEPGANGTPSPVVAPVKPTPAAKVYSETEFNDVVTRERAAASELEQLRTWKAEQEQAVKTREEQEAAQRGEFKKLHETEKSAHEQTRKDYETKLAAERDEKAKALERFKQTRIKETLASAYTAARGTSPALFERVISDFIADGTVKADDDGKVTGHLDALKKILEAHPQLFHNTSKDAVEKALADIAGGVAGVAAGFVEKQTRAKRAPFSVAEAHATAAPKPNWRVQK